MIIARGIAITRVNLKTSKKSGIKTKHIITVRHPVAKYFVSNIGQSFQFFLSDGTYGCFGFKNRLRNNLSNCRMYFR